MTYRKNREAIIGDVSSSVKMVGMNQMANQKTRGGLRLFPTYRRDKLRYNQNGKAKTRQPKKSDASIVVFYRQRGAA